MKLNPKLMHRRQALTALAGAGIAAALRGNPSVANAATVSCLSPSPALEEGPYFIEEKLLRSDIRSDPATGVVQQGTLVTLSITIQNQNGVCGPLAGAYIDIWHASATGLYSDEAQENTIGQKYLRGYQITDDNGNVQFTTIYPGWYSGRTVHIHVRVRTYSGASLLANFETQAFFDDSATDVVFAQAPYNSRGARDTRNATDRVYTGSSSSSLNLWTLTKTNAGYAAALNLAVNVQTPAASLPSIAAGGIANAASGAAGIAPGAWISVYGANLATAARALASTDIVSSAIPAALGGVSVQIDGKAAFVDYVSASQINVLAPDDATTGSVLVAVTNAAGTSAAIAAVSQPLLPGLFTLSNYAAAVRPSDGAIINGTGAAVSGYTTAAAAKAGDVLELYGTGFGPATGAPATGTVFSGAYPTVNAVAVTIAGVSAFVSFAGLVGPGLYQINLTVPGGLSAGDNIVIASAGGFNSQSTALLKIATS